MRSRDEAKPGFLEVDLVAHCGGRLQGGCLYTITLTDVAIGWTECLPLLNRGREAVLAALQRAVLPDEAAAAIAVATVRAEAAHVPIVVRAATQQGLARLFALGAEHVISPELEGAWR